MEFEVAIYPSWRGVDNPYLRLLAESLIKTGACVAVEDVSIGFLRRRRGIQKIVHLQWVPTITRSGPECKRLFYFVYGNAKVFAALLDIWLIKMLRGAKVVWTIHDALIPDEHHPALMRLLRALHFWLADGYVVHCEAARRDIPFRYRKKPCIMLPRPNVIGVYGPIVSRDEALRMRKYLDIPAHATVFLVFGLLRNYKRIGRIISAFGAIAPKLERAILLIVGAPYDMQVVADILRRSAGMPCVIPLFRKIDNRYVARLFAASDYVVIGQERGYTSGVMFTAMSYKKPVLIRNWGAAGEYIRDGENGFLFEWDELPAIFERAIEVKKSSPAYRRMCEEAYRTMEPLTWDRFAKSLSEFYRTFSAAE